MIKGRGATGREGKPQLRKTSCRGAISRL